jgi:hypothetical protein
VPRPRPRTETADQGGAVESSAVEERADVDLAGIPTVTGPYDGRIAVAEDINPPTNSWVSPAVFAPEDRPIFTGILSARLAADEVTVGLPDPVTDAKVVMAPHPDHVALGLSADDYQLAVWTRCRPASTTRGTTSRWASSPWPRGGRTRSMSPPPSSASSFPTASRPTGRT